MQADAIKPGQNVVVVDDLIATGECVCTIAQPDAQGYTIERRIRIRCRPAREEAGGNCSRVFIHHRINIPQSGKEARCTSLLYNPER